MLESRAKIAGDDTVRLVAAVGHDLRHLVGALSHQVELLSGDGLDATLRDRCLRSIVQTGAEFDRFVDVLADLERTLRGEHSARLEGVDLRAMIRTVILDRAHEAVDLADVHPPGSIAWVDPAIARRVLQILVAECEAMSDAVTIDLSSTPDVIEVVITGGAGRSMANTHDVRPIRETDGLAPWIASRLGRLSGIDVVIDTAARSFLVRLPSASPVEA